MPACRSRERPTTTQSHRLRGMRPVRSKRGSVRAEPASDSHGFKKNVDIAVACGRQGAIGLTPASIYKYDYSSLSILKTSLSRPCPFDSSS